MLCGEPSSATCLPAELLGLRVVSQTQPFPAAEFRAVLSELGSVIYAEPPGCTAVSRVVYILWKSDSVSRLSRGELVDLVDSSLSQRGAVTCGEEPQDHHPGVVQEELKIRTYSPALNQ